MNNWFTDQKEKERRDEQTYAYLNSLFRQTRCIRLGLGGLSCIGPVRPENSLFTLASLLDPPRR